jgi:Tol biopolymer transport system component
MPSLSAGDKLGPYEILALIGAGGMGEVYRARDTRLNRDVAVKISTSQFDERFDREARAVAALNHPNICTLYDIGPNYLVMEYIEGEAPKGPLPLEEALRIARQIADALEAAHEKGITHLDLKPANIKLKPDGTVKVLDFGLAKTSPAREGGGADSPTLSMAATQAGVILGTAAYMSPEQARGKSIDKRADIWAFGVVLYELLTGKRLFQGEDVSHTMAAVIMQEPQLDAIPAPVKHMLKACLEKDPKKRLRDIGDVWRLMEQSESTAPAPAAAATSRSRLGLLGWILAGLVSLALAGLAAIHFREAVTEAPSLRTSLLAPPATEFDFNQGAGLLSLSPDGKKIVFGAHSADGKNLLWVRSLDGLAAQPLAGTEGALFPFWSPDSKSIAFFADGKLKKIEAGGGAVVALAEVRLGRGGSWNQDDVIIFGTNPVSEIQRVSSAGGTPAPVSKEQGRFPSFLPDGQHYLYEVERGPAVTLRIGSLDGSPSKELKNVGNANTNAIYSQGHILYLREGTLMAQSFDTKRLETAGEAVPVAEQVERVLNSGTVGAFSVSQDGLLAYRTGRQLSADTGAAQMTWFDRQGKAVSEGEQPLSTEPALSPDGTQVAFTRIQAQGDTATADIWLHEFAGGRNTRFTSDPGLDASPVWSPDGIAIVFASERDGKRNLYQKASNNGSPETPLFKSDEDKVALDWSRDGRYLLFESIGAKTNADIWYLPMEKSSSPPQAKPYLQTAFYERNARFSPDGRFVAYQSNESGSNEIYVQTFPDPMGGKWTISKGGGQWPVWRKDGKELFYLFAPQARGYISPNGFIGARQLMAVDVTTTPSGPFKFGTPKSMFEMPPGIAPFATIDGQKFLGFMAPGTARTAPEAGAAPAPSAPITLVLNWAPRAKTRP